MEKNQKRIEGEFAVPEEIIQHIQSFMDETEAARTTLLSMSWYAAWSTRPNLNFNQHLFDYLELSTTKTSGFPEFTKKTMQRYEDLNLHIKAFTLNMINRDASLATELISKAIKLGVTDLTLKGPTFVRSFFVLPDEALESQTLTQLSVDGYQLDLERRSREVTCPNLKFLKVSHAIVEGDLIRDLISRCPSIEELTLELPMLSKTLHNINYLHRVDVGAMIKLHKLKYLRMVGLDIKDSLFKYDFWPQFPCLKELVIMDHYRYYYKWDDVRICSPSLEHITIRLSRNRIVYVEFNVPNIRKLVFEGRNIPHLKLKTSSREWESDIHIKRKRRASARWFLSLKQLVKALSPSRVSLSIFVKSFEGGGDGYVGYGLAIPAVEDLMIEGYGAMSPHFLIALFCCCRPKFLNIARACMKEVNAQVLQQLHALPWKINSLFDDFDEFVCFPFN